MTTTLDEQLVHRAIIWFSNYASGAPFDTGYFFGLAAIATMDYKIPSPYYTITTLAGINTKIVNLEGENQW